MKNKKLFLFTLLVTLFAGCSKESVIQPPTEPEDFSAQSTSQTRGVLYVNNFNTTVDNFTRILGNAIKEDELLNWCKIQGFTEINLSSVGKVLNADSAMYLNEFVGKAHSALYRFKVNFITSSSTGVIQIGTYCANYPNKPDGLITEYEFWNCNHGPNSFATFKTILSKMTDLHNTYPSISRYAYIGSFEDCAGVHSTDHITHYLIDNCERIFFADYISNAFEREDKLKEKLKPLSDKAKQIHKVANVIILFNLYRGSSSANIYSYFSTDGNNHQFVDAYSNLMEDYNNTYDEDDDGMSFKGYAIFRHTDARQARP